MILPALAQAQEKLTVNFPSESARLVFSSPAWPTAIAGTEEVKTDKKIDFDLGSIKPTDYIVVLDRDTNNVAIRQTKDIKGGAWDVQTIDYRYLGNVTVRVEHEGKPIAAAGVLMESKGKSQTQLIDPSSKGEARFFAIEPGDLKVQVTYRVGQRSLSTKQGFEVPLTRSRVDPVLVVSIPDDVSTTTASLGSGTSTAATGSTGSNSKQEDAKTKEGSPSDGKEPATKETPRGGLGTGVAMLLGLALAIGGGYFLLQWINQNPGRLKQLGVPVPDPAPVPDGAQPGAAPAAYQPPTPEPVQQILLGDAPPTPIGQASLTVTPAQIATAGVPRLVGDGGRIIDLSSGESLVGRDDGLPVSLAGESTVSRRHASVRLDGHRATVTDLGSTNGTFVNGNKVTGEVGLEIGDVVQFGSVRFRYEA